MKEKHGTKDIVAISNRDHRSLNGINIDEDKETKITNTFGTNYNEAIDISILNITTEPRKDNINNYHWLEENCDNEDENN